MNELPTAATTCAGAPILVFDIETIPNQFPDARDRIAATISPPKSMTKAETIAKWEAEERPRAIDDAWRKTALDGGRGQTAVIGWCINDQPVQTEFVEEWEGGDAAIIRGFFSSVTEQLRDLTRHGNSLRPILVGHNHTGFDIRFLYRRCVVLGIQPPAWWPAPTFKPWDDRLFDTMLAWAGARDYVRMDEVCEVLGIALKGSELAGENADDMDGSRVWDYVRDGRIDLVARYCAGDVERTRAMYRRMTFQAAPLAIAEAA